MAPGWFSETSLDGIPGVDKDDMEAVAMQPGQAFSIKVDQVLLDVTSKYQHVQVLKTFVDEI